MHAMIYDIMNDGQRKQYEEVLECDFSFAIPGLARFRVNAFNQERGAAAVLRNQLDFDASAVFTGLNPLQTAADELLNLVLEVASGTLTWGEILNEGDEVVARLGEAL